ncbi:MAG TPA: phospholipase D-like domain-containing protein [Chloroflexota bacterium]|nr:phospholipase D-like domain-containing protein [Chloroflexota bacterium]
MARKKREVAEDTVPAGWPLTDHKPLQFSGVKDVRLFFNRPARPLSIDALLSDIEKATSRVTAASAWFTNREIARAILRSKAERKVVILNATDLRRDGTSPILEMLGGGALGAPGPHSFRNGVYVAGGVDFRQGVMHHKFVVADDIVWTGSYNFTYQAAKNYELLIRIADKAVAEAFYWETLEVVDDSTIWAEGESCRMSSSAFWCGVCDKVRPIDQLSEGSDAEDAEGLACKACVAAIGEGVARSRGERSQ